MDDGDRDYVAFLGGTAAGVDATTGLIRVWFASDDQLGVLQPSAGDFDTDHATRRMKAELRRDDPT